VEEIKQGYHGWNLLADGLFVEQFISGKEYTTFITGSYDDPENCIVYEPVEREFHDALPENERLLSYERLWEVYEDESPMPNGDYFYDYKPVKPELIPALKEISLKAFASCQGKGYARLDIRMDDSSGRLYMLEVNAQCGLSEDADYTSIGAILKASNVSFTSVISEILKDALRRSVVHPAPAKKTKASKRKKSITVK
jgi:D-alanine-D-alanine ligase